MAERPVAAPLTLPAQYAVAPTPRRCVFRAAGFAEAELRDLTARLLALEQPDSPFAAPLPGDIARRARWTRPVLAAEVTYAEITPAGRMRHPVWRGLRPA